MTKEDLLAMLDLPTRTGKSDLEVSEAEEGGEAQIPLNPTALELDEWSMRMGREVLEGSEVIQKAIGLQDAGTPGDGNEIDSSSLKGEALEKFNDSAKLVADFHGAAFEPEPKMAPACENPRLQQYMKNLLETPEFQALHKETSLDEMASEFAAAAFAKEWVTLSKTEPGEGMEEEMRVMRHAGVALQESKQEVERLRDAQDALGIGHKEISGAFKRVRDSEQLRKICQLAGRYRRLAQAKQRQKVVHGRDDMVGVTLDGDIGRLLPHELAQLDDPDLGLDVMRRIIERQAMCREYRGIETKAKGPIVVVVDESGSMSGEPIWTAKAIALALAWIARSQKRFCCLVGFAGATEGNFLVIPPGKNDEEGLMNWLEHFFSGGTDMDVPCDILPKRWEELGCPKGKTDVIVITDAICTIPPLLRKSFNAWKAAEKVKMISLVINSAPGDLALVSDQVHRVPSLSIEQEAVGEALSV